MRSAVLLVVSTTGVSAILNKLRENEVFTNQMRVLTQAQGEYMTPLWRIEEDLRLLALYKNTSETATAAEPNATTPFGTGVDTEEKSNSTEHVDKDETQETDTKKSSTNDKKEAQTGKKSEETTKKPTMEDARKIAEEMHGMKNIDDAIPKGMPPAAQMPIMKAFLEMMIDRFKKNIAEATRNEEKSKERYKKQCEEWDKKPESWKKDPAMARINDYWKKSRMNSKRHYHAMLKMAHGSINRIKWTMGLLDRAMAGEKISEEDQEAMNEMVSGGHTAAGSNQGFLVFVQNILARAPENL